MAVQRHKEHVSASLTIAATIRRRAADLDIWDTARRRIAEQEMLIEAARAQLVTEDGEALRFDPTAADQLTKHAEAQLKFLDKGAAWAWAMAQAAANDNTPSLDDARDIIVAVMADRVQPRFPAAITRCLERAGIPAKVAQRVGKALASDLLGEVVVLLMEEEEVLALKPSTEDQAEDH